MIKENKKPKPVCEVLKQLRKNANITQKEAYESLGVPQSTFSSWERGVAEPNIKTLISLCQMYGVKDIFGAFGYDGSDKLYDVDLNYQEEELIQKYRQLSSYDQETIRSLVKRMVHEVSIAP